MSEQFPYTTKLDIKFKHFEVIDIPQMVSETKDKPPLPARSESSEMRRAGRWFNQTLTEVNGCVVRVGIVEGEYHWHKHENDDEFFFVLEGKLFVDLRESVPLGEDKTIELNPGQGVTITRNTIHRTRAPQKTVMLMVENRNIIPTGD